MAFDSAHHFFLVYACPFAIVFELVKFVAIAAWFARLIQIATEAGDKHAPDLKRRVCIV